MTKSALTFQRIDFWGDPKIKSSLVVGIPLKPCPSLDAYSNWLQGIIQAVNDLQDKGYFYRMSEEYAQLAHSLSSESSRNQIGQDQVPWFGWSRLVLPIGQAGEESYTPSAWPEIEKMVSDTGRGLSYLPSGEFPGRTVRLAEVKRTLADIYRTLRQPYSDVLYLDLTPRREAGFLACAMWAQVHGWHGMAKIIAMAQDFSGPGLGVTLPQRELLRRLTPKAMRPSSIYDYDPYTPSYEGFYLDEDGKKQDSDFFGDDEPADPEGFNRCMWEKFLKDGYSVEGLTRLYGPRPAGV